MSALTDLEIERTFRDDVAVLTPRGVLDLSSYAQLRDVLLKSALELPRAVVVDISALMVPTDATLAVFPSVWMQVSEWPGVPIILVAGQELTRRRLRHTAILRYVPVHATLVDAIDSVDAAPHRRRAVLELPYDPVSASSARRFVDVVCTRWGCADLATEAVMIASELVENAVRHANSDARLRLELRRDLLTIAVYDEDPTPIQRVEPWTRTPPHLGLLMVSRLAASWNCAPTMSGGKVVWAVLRRDRPVPVNGHG